MKQSFIIVTEISENLLTNGLMDFANQYSGESFVNNIELYKGNGTDNFLILFSNVPNFDHFCFAVNYIRYIKTPNKKLSSAFGYYLNNSNKYSFLTNGFVKTYVSSNDKEYDNVNVVNSNNETYLFDFGGSQKKLSIIEQSFEVPEINISDYTHILNIIPSPIKDKPWWKIW
jgi:hypothetical protein